MTAFLETAIQKVTQGSDEIPVRFTGTTETAVVAGPCYVQGIIAGATSAGTLTIRNAAAAGGGSTPIAVLDVATFAVYPMWGAYFSNGVALDGSDAATDVTVIYTRIYPRS